MVANDAVPCWDGGALHQMFVSEHRRLPVPRLSKCKSPFPPETAPFSHSIRNNVALSILLAKHAGTRWPADVKCA
jgi:hypothetical protein